MYAIFSYSLVYRKRIYLPNSGLTILTSSPKPHHPYFWTLFMESSVKLKKKKTRINIRDTHIYAQRFQLLK